MSSDYVAQLASHALRKVEEGEEIRAIILQYLLAVPATSDDLANALDSHPLLQTHLGLVLLVDVVELAEEAFNRIKTGRGAEIEPVIRQHLQRLPESHFILVQEFIARPEFRIRIASTIWYTSSSLAVRAFKRMETGEKVRDLLPRIPTSHELAEDLEDDPERQLELAEVTDYTPSRWLLDRELRHVDARRAHYQIDRSIFSRDAYRRAANAGLMGMCFSGGGIRSATFNLGILQGLAELKLLHCFDYLSSVSGGGYIHQWLAAWSRRVSFSHVTEQLIPLPEENNPRAHPEPIRWLKRYSNYLTPRVGLLTADTWVAAGTWLRNTILNQIILITGLIFLVLLPHLLVSRNLVPDPGSTEITIVFLFLLASFLLGGNLYWLEQEEDHLVFGQRLVQALLVLPLLLAALLLIFLFTVVDLKFSLSTASLILGSLFFLFAAAITVLGRAFDSYLQHHKPIGGQARPRGTAFIRQTFAVLGLTFVSVFAALCGAAWVILTRIWIYRPWSLSDENWRRMIMVLGPPLLLAGPFITILILIGLLGRTFLDARREWMARFAAWVGLYALAWIVCVGLSLFGHAIVAWLIAVIPAGVSALVSWITGSGAAVISGMSSKTSGVNNDNASSVSLLDVISIVGSYVFVAGLLLLVAWLGETLLRLAQPRGLWALLAIYIVPLLLCVLFAWRVDINEFSMHAFYRNRLVRCYLGASNKYRKPNPFTGFDKNDASVALKDLVPAHQYYGPFPIFCTSLNLTFGEDLAWQERKAASFIFTPLYSGYDIPWTAEKKPNKKLRFNGFVVTENYAYPPAGIHISTAAAISGAALSPNWGFHTNPVTAFVLTIFNVRLGWWLSNPRALNLDGTSRTTRRKALGMFRRRPSCPPPSPRVALVRLVGELLGRADDVSRYIYLTDGGHFDNMGLYELVRRRCRYIVICDAEEDAQLQFEGIGMAIRKCRIDFGVEISLDLRALLHVGQTQYSSAHCVVGTICYPENPDNPGVVVYLKSSLTGDEPGDILNYKKEDPAFPHDTTLNQWFTESQFESYRRLGQHVAFSTFEPASPDSNDCARLQGRHQYFSNLRSIWCAPTPEMQQHSAEHSKRYEALLRDIRNDTQLPGLFEMLFDPDATDWEFGRDQAIIDHGIRISSALIEFMWLVYEDLRLVLPDNRNHPFAKGWFTIFRAWCKIDVVQEGWRRYRKTYSRSFCLFVQREFGLPEA